MRFAADRPLGLAPATAADYRELARRRLPRQLFDYLDGGAYDEMTMHANVRDLQQVLLRQVVMRDVRARPGGRGARATVTSRSAWSRATRTSARRRSRSLAAMLLRAASTSA